MRINRWWVAILIVALCTTEGFTQQLRLGISSAANIKSAVLELQSTNQGLLFTRIADTALINTLNPPDGMVVYFTPAKRLLLRASGAWQSLAFTTSIDTTSISNFYLKVRNELSGGTGINYNNVTGVITNAGVTTLNGNTGALTMDTGYISNFYSKVRSRFTAGTGISYNSTTGVISNGGVTSLNGNTGALTMDTGYIPNFYQKVRGLFSAGSGISYNSTTGVITASGAAGSNWALNGNTVGALKTLGTVDNYDLPFITNNTERMRISNTGNVAIGTNVFDSVPEKLVIDAGVTNSYNLLIAKGERNGYLQFNIQNNSSQGQASTDIVATADNGTETTNYVDLGINGSGYNNANNILSGANNGYLYSNGQDFIVGNTATSKSLILFTGGIATSNERMRITSAGKVGIGTTSPATTLDVAGTYKLGSSGTALNNMIKTTFSITDNNTFSLGTTKVITATVSGATTGATVIINPRSQLPTAVAIAYSYISSANTITIGFMSTQSALSPSTLGSITFDVTLIQ